MRIAVIGCGPGGMASALFLKRAGHEVVLFDQFATPRPLGSGLLIQPSGQHILGQLGLLDQIRDRAAPVTRLSGINMHNGKRALDMQYCFLGADSHALGIHRASLFQLLFEAVGKADIELHTGCQLTAVAVDNDRVKPRFEGRSEEVSFDLLIDASGANSPLASGQVRQLPFAALWTTVDMPPGTAIADAALDQRYVGAHKMAGVMPVGINPQSGHAGAALFWSIKPDEMAALHQRGLEAWQQEFLKVWPEASPFVMQITSLDELVLAIYRHRTGIAVTNDRIFHMGDAWHCTSPQLGQGANMALIDAAAIATAIEHACSLAEIGAHYRYLRSDHVKLYQALSYIFTPLYQSDSRILPALRDVTIHYAGRLPMVRSLIASVVSGNLGRFN
jgi:salicylate hydroxylase